MRDRFVTVYKRVERIEEAKENKEAPKKAQEKKKSYLKRHTGAAKIQESQKHLAGYTMLDFALFEDDHRDIQKQENAVLIQEFDENLDGEKTSAMVPFNIGPKD